MLIYAASLLRASVKAGDFIARVGGDEFVIVITGESDEQRLAAFADRIIEQMRQPVAYQNHRCRVGVSIGIAVANPDEAESGRASFINAYIALYQAKNNGRDWFKFFTASLKAERVRTKRVAADILNGLELQEFIPYFQPQFDA